jgi:hypothetical protein
MPADAGRDPYSLDSLRLDLNAEVQDAVDDVIELANDRRSGPHERGTDAIARATICRPFRSQPARWPPASQEILSVGSDRTRVVDGIGPDSAGSSPTAIVRPEGGQSESDRRNTSAAALARSEFGPSVIDSGPVTYGRPHEPSDLRELAHSAGHKLVRVRGWLGRCDVEADEETRDVDEESCVHPTEGRTCPVCHGVSQIQC